MALSRSEKTREYERRRRERGEIEIRVWIPDTSFARAVVRAVATALCEQAAERASHGDDSAA